jgi:hypothetical protein
VEAAELVGYQACHLAQVLLKSAHTAMWLLREGGFLLFKVLCQVSRTGTKLLQSMAIAAVHRVSMGAQASSTHETPMKNSRVWWLGYGIGGSVLQSGSMGKLS